MFLSVKLLVPSNLEHNRQRYSLVIAYFFPDLRHRSTALPSQHHS
jgi:hypothetical protein